MNRFLLIFFCSIVLVSCKSTDSSSLSGVGLTYNHKIYIITSSQHDGFLDVEVCDDGVLKNSVVQRKIGAKFTERQYSVFGIDRAISQAFEKDNPNATDKELSVFTRSEEYRTKYQNDKQVRSATEKYLTLGNEIEAMKKQLVDNGGCQSDYKAVEKTVFYANVQDLIRKDEKNRVKILTELNLSEQGGRKVSAAEIQAKVDKIFLPNSSESFYSITETKTPTLFGIFVALVESAK